MTRRRYASNSFSLASSSRGGGVGEGTYGRHHDDYLYTEIADYDEGVPLVLSDDHPIFEGPPGNDITAATSTSSTSMTLKKQRLHQSNNIKKQQYKARRRTAKTQTSFELHNKNSPVDFYFTCHGCCWVQCVRTNEVAIVTQLGKFHDIEQHGLLCLPLWPFRRVEQRLSLRIQQLDLTCETKTKDNVFITLEIAVLYKVDNPHKAYYSLSNPQIQIQSFVFDQVRSTIPFLDVDDLYTTSQDVSLDILRSLQFFMVTTYGYDILNLLILNLYPSDVKVRNAINEINSCKRMKEAMVNRGEAEKIYQIKKAEAHAESLYLNGIGIANERKAINKGIKEIMHNFEDHYDIKAGPLISGKSVMDLLLVTQYYDMLVAIGDNDDTKDNTTMYEDHGNNGTTGGTTTLMMST